MGTEVQTLRKSTNWSILNAIKTASSTEYQRRVPDATRANVQETIREMWDYAPTRNEFLDAFINRIGLVVARNVSWTNPLAKFKIGMLEYGDTIEEYIAGLLVAKTYDPKRDYLEKDLFGQEVPDVQTSFHKVNRQDYYKITINEPILKRAFLDEYGLSGLIVQLMQSPTTSDNWDEFLLTCSLFREYWDNDGFFKVKIPDVSASGSTAADSKAFIRRVRELADTLPFLSTQYNAAGMPIAANRDELELIITPEALAAVDVEALAGAFNVDKADFGTRVTVIPKEYFGITGAQAILTTRDFFVIADQRLETRSINNPVGLYDNYFLHHWQVISASRFVPAILFTSTEESSTIAVQDTPVTSIAALKLYDSAQADVTAGGKVTRGSYYTVVGTATTTPAGGPNDAIRFDLVGAKSPRTIMSNTGVLYAAPDEDATSLTINATATDNNTITQTLTVNVVGDKVNVWPLPDVLTDDDADALIEFTPKPVPAAPTSGASKNKVTIPQPGEGYDYKDGATTVNGQTLTLTANKTITVAAKAGYEAKTGATTSWTLVFTA